jgi:ribose/xylose/arabinose/galactoside ABC-type transport system permease subunit
MPKLNAKNETFRWRWLNRFGPLLALLLVFGFFAFLNPRIATFTALETIVQQTVIVGIAAIGMTLVIISGGIDLSAGSIIAFGSVVVALCMESLGLPPLAAALCGILAGCLWGTVNGLLITRFRLVPFIVTLGTLLIVRGFAKGLAGSMPIDAGHTWLSDILASLPAHDKWQLIPPGGWLMILLALLLSGLLKYTGLGRHIFAVGSNEHTARLCGVAVEKVKVAVYAIAGAFSGLAGLMLMSYQEQCQLNGWPTWVTQIVTGAVIVVAVALDRMRHRRLA